MPILPKETDIHPVNLLEDSSNDETWWLFYTLSRREKDLMRRLIALDIGFYGPLIARKKRSPSGRVRTSYVPLFPGYIFVKADSERRQQALTTNCVSRTMEIVDKEGLLEDLSQIHRLIDSETPLAPESRIQAGTRVRVKTGSLAGVEGIVSKRHNGDRLLVVVKFLQQGASVSLDDFEVEAI